MLETNYPYLHKTNIIIILVFILFITTTEIDRVHGRSVRLEECEGSKDLISCGPSHRCIQLAPNSWTCLCKAGYAAIGSKIAMCQKIDICQQIPDLCLNGGKCTSNDVDPTVYTCTCRAGFAGKNCERAQSICDTGTLCLNGGQCIVTPTSSLGFQCICPQGFKGDTCAIPVTVGIGGAGVVLTGGTLVFIWTLWIALMITFLYCGFRITAGCCTKRFQKAAVQGAVSSL